MYFIPLALESENGEPLVLRQIMVVQDGLELPRDTYIFVENFCIDKNCDCHKVMINAISESNGKILGTFTYGWEKLGYYTKWLYGDKELATELKGPSLEVGGIQSEYAEILLEKFKDLVEDEKYCERIEKHHQLFKKRLEEIRDEDACLCGSPRRWKDCCAKLTERLDPYAEEDCDIASKPALGRNDPCHCGSGRKYKKCCFSRDEEINDLLKNISNFPIHECLINEDWENSGLATIVVIREHPKTGLFSFVSFLVDIFCLGLKNAMAEVGVDEDMVVDYISIYPQSFIEIDYEECRGILLGGIDYAKNLGFEPHDDWEKVTGFVEGSRSYETRHKFGKNGKPFYVEGPDDDVGKIMQILGGNP